MNIFYSQTPIFVYGLPCFFVCHCSVKTVSQTQKFKNEILVGKLGEISDISAISRAGSLASKAGEAVNPISQIFGAGAKVVRGAAELGAQGLGFTSQMGKNAAKEIFNSAGAPKVVEAMRGKVPGEKIFNEAEESLAIMRENASSKFRGKLEELDKVKANLNPGLVKDALEDRLAKFKISRDSSGALDFSRSPIAGDPHAVQSVQTAVKFVDDFGSQAGDFTPSGFDNLKQRLDNIFSASSQSKAFTTPLRKAAFKTIEDAVPDYALWEKDYSVFKDLSGELEKAFSLKDSASANTAIGKLTNALGKNSEFKQTLLNRMESASGKEITQQIAGKAASQVFPERGIVGAILGSATASSYFSKAAGTKILALFPLASPRIVGEFLNVLGVAKNTTEKILKTIRADKLAKPSTIQAAFQSGRVNESVPEKKKLVFGGQ